MSYQEAVLYLEGLVNYEKISKYPYKLALNLERVRAFLALIKNPESALKFIHVAGSKGKGSICAFIAYILREAGFKTGLYTSPHLKDFRERIRILKPRAPRRDFEGMIPKGKLAGLVKGLKSRIDKFNRTSAYGPLSFFEVTTILAIQYFKEEKADFVVLETGLGGRLDATNAVYALISVISPISYEHMDKLGRTLKKIASEKAGIIKNNAVVICAPQEKEAMQVVEEKCKKESSKLIKINQNTYPGLKIKLIGKHQLMNAAVALTAVKALSGYGIKVGIDSIQRGLYNTLWPGRCEVVAHNPYVVLDGAQNSASAAALKRAVKENFKYKNLILVFGVSSDKDIKGISLELDSLADEVVLTKAQSPRAANPENLKKYFLNKNRKTYIAESVKSAKNIALKLAGKEDLILVTGSLFVVGEARKEKWKILT